MSLVTVATVNGLLAVGILAALAYVCRLPFRINISEPPVAAGSASGEPDHEQEQIAA
jgi:hypothetical protein